MSFTSVDNAERARNAEKIRPLDNKLKNQIEKLIRTAAVSDQAVDGSNPLQFRPNPDAFVSKVCIYVYARCGRGLSLKQTDIAGAFILTGRG